ncbi:MAG TPA: GNAT family N-acetyltransferase [Steroidobacteraceae bacterium]|jgi:ribosomal-protein-alanine N-acetyltransferase|nr:GNAT family N-acetyltransferase [Steroidobacteraceae bacterium]
MHDYRFELASTRDAGAIASLSRRIIEAGLPPAWPADRVLCHIKRTDSVVLTARVHGLLTGFAIMQFGDTHAHLNLLAVESAYQRQGLGHQLMNWLHHSALVAGTFDVGLELRAGNTGARRFYESLNYRAGDLMRGYYQGLEDALRMTCDLRVDRSLTA